MTKEGIEKLKRTLKRITESDLPQAIEDVRTYGELGDFSENAEYQEAKGRMRRLRNRAMSIEEKLKHVIPIENDGSETVQLGSSVRLQSKDDEKTFELVGPAETNPAKGRISHISPLGSDLIGKSVGDKVSIQEKEYQIIELQ